MFAKSKSKNNARFSGRTHRKLGMEGLEGRNLMAGNVIAALGTDGTLRITGNESSNGVAIRQTGASSYLVSGLPQGGSNTLVNNSPTAGFTNVRGLSVDMRGGNDRLEVGTANTLYRSTNFARGMNLVTGSGNDSVAINRTSTYLDVTIDTGSGADQVTIQNTRVGLSSDEFRQGDLYISTGAGSDRINVNNSSVVGEMAVHPGVGAFTDDLRISAVDIGLNLLVNSNELDYFRNEGQLNATLSRVTAGDNVIVNTRATQAAVTLETVAADRVFVAMGSRNDSLSLINITAGSKVVEGGAGSDYLYLEQAGSVSRTGFETVSYGLSRWLLIR